MSQIVNPVTKNSDLLKVLTSVSDKLIVDFVNSIDIAKDHIVKQSVQSDFFYRCLGGIAGNSHRRQLAINTNLNDSVSGALHLINKLGKELVLSDYAIQRANDKLVKLDQQLMRVASYSAETRDIVSKLKAEFDERMNRLEHDISRIDSEQKARGHLDEVFSKWSAGRFSVFSPAGRCYAAVEELRWGAFGYYLNNNAKDDLRTVKALSDLAVNRAIKQLADDVGVSVYERVGAYEKWFFLPCNTLGSEDLHEGLAYLADDFDKESAPFVTTITQQLPERLTSVPYIANARRVSEAIFEEVFCEHIK